MVTPAPDPDVCAAVRGFNVLTAACVRMFQLSFGTGRQSVFHYILSISADASLVSAFVSSGSKVLLDLTDREKYVA